MDSPNPVTARRNTAAQAIEARSIDYIPPSERHGKAWHLGPVFFLQNFAITTMLPGIISLTLGGNIIWSFIATTLGIVVGSGLTVLHASQGPHMGLPQMIQSRAQFGIAGTAIPVGITVFLALGLGVLDGTLGAEAVSAVVKLPSTVSLVIVVGLGVLISTLGYAFIHKFSKWYFVLAAVTFIIFTAAVPFVVSIPSEQWDITSFAPNAFFVQFAAVLAFQLSFSPLVADFTRYLPDSTPFSKTAFWCFVGMGGSAFYFMFMGAVLMVQDPSQSAIDVVLNTGNSIFDGFGVFVLIVAAIELIGVTGALIYSGALDLLTFVDSVREVSINTRKRVISSICVGGAIFLGGLYATGQVLDVMGLFLSIAIYVLVPWSAINLTDFFIIRKANYRLAEFDARRVDRVMWKWQGILAYVIAILFMVPFFELQFFEGPLAAALGGADIAPIVGFGAGLIAYYLFMRPQGIASSFRQGSLEDVSLAAEAEGV